MKLQIEKWVEITQPFTEKAAELFTEAIADYKIGSYKSAFLMSYIAFKVTIRNRVLNFDCSDGLPNTAIKDWNNDVVEKLKNEDHWEYYTNKIVLDSCGNNSENIFNIMNFTNPERVKEMYKYWICMRNACSHGKTYTIGSATVESFWYYLMDNFSQFYVPGSDKYLTNALADAYIYYKNPNVFDRDKIPGILHDAYTVFQDTINVFFKKFFDVINVSGPIVDTANKGFWDSIIHNDDSHIRNGFISYILDQRYFFLHLYKFFPELIELSSDSDPKYASEALTNILCCVNKPYQNPQVNGILFWDLLLNSVTKYPNAIGLNRVICKTTYSLINYLQDTADNIRILNEHGILKSCILNMEEDWYFLFDSDRQFDNRYRNFQFVEKLFSYVAWDYDLLSKLDSTIAQFNTSMPFRSEQRKVVGDKFKASWSQIIKDNWEKIECVEDWEKSVHVIELLKTLD